MTLLRSVKHVRIFFFFFLQKLQTPKAALTFIETLFQSLTMARCLMVVLMDEKLVIGLFCVAESGWSDSVRFIVQEVIVL